MDFLTNLVSVGASLIFLALLIISVLIVGVVGHIIGNKYGQSDLGGLIGLVVWAWILVSFITSDEFLAWSGLI